MDFNEWLVDKEKLRLAVKDYRCKDCEYYSNKGEAPIPSKEWCNHFKLKAKGNVKACKTGKKNLRSV